MSKLESALRPSKVELAGPQPIQGSPSTPVETILAGCWSGSGFTCAGCGQPPPSHFDRLAAIGLAQDLPPRFAALLQRADRFGGLSSPGARSVLEPVYYASGFLAFAVSQVLLMTGRGDEVIAPLGTPIDALATETKGRGTATVLSNLFAYSDRLTGAIEDATDRQWNLFLAAYAATAGQLVWLALHGGIHHLEDTALSLDIASRQLLGPRA